MKPTTPSGYTLTLGVGLVVSVQADGALTLESERRVQSSLGVLGSTRNCLPGVNQDRYCSPVASVRKARWARSSAAPAPSSMRGLGWTRAPPSAPAVHGAIRRVGQAPYTGSAPRSSTGRCCVFGSVACWAQLSHCRDSWHAAVPLHLRYCRIFVVLRLLERGCEPQNSTLAGRSLPWQLAPGAAQAGVSCQGQ